MTERPQYANVELEAVERWPSGLVVTLQSGVHLWQVECDGADLQSFRRFQGRVANDLFLWIGHDSQYVPVVQQRRRAWQSAVGRAFRKGSDYRP